MTHGDIYIPIIMDNGETKYLYCEAWSDGYFDGVGYAMLASSNHMKDVIKLNTIFVGSPFYYDPDTNKFMAKEGDYIAEGYEDSDTENETMKEAGIEAVSLFEQGTLEDVYQSDFAKMSLDEKLKEGFGMNAELKTLDDILEETKIITNVSEIMELLKTNLKEESIETYEISSTEYLFHDNQWLVKMYDEEYTHGVYIPMIIGALSFTDYNEGQRSGCLADPFSYIEKYITQEDFKTMNELYHYNIENSINMDDRGWNHIKPWLEKQLLEKVVNEPNRETFKVKV